jgi:hypothetical protein
VEAFRALAYPYHLAVTQVDFAIWLIEQSREAEAAPLVEEAQATFTSLRAAPALERARRLAGRIAGAPAGSSA